jgi:hypothetical protein
MTPRKLTPAWNWDRLTKGTAEWRVAWEDLGAWVQWYIETYELWQSMPVCWYRHSRLVEDLRALRFHHQSVFDAAVPAREEVGSRRRSGPSARAYSDWMTARRNWERLALGLDPREHGGCSGLSHSRLAASTKKGRNARLQTMADGLRAMLDATVPGRTSELGGDGSLEPEAVEIAEDDSAEISRHRLRSTR